MVVMKMKVYGIAKDEVFNWMTSLEHISDTEMNW